MTCRSEHEPDVTVMVPAGTLARVPASTIGRVAAEVYRVEFQLIKARNALSAIRAVLDTLPAGETWRPEGEPFVGGEYPPPNTGQFVPRRQDSDGDAAA